MRHPMMSVLEQNPVLPAVKDAGRLEACLAQPAGVVFLLGGDILNIDRLIDRVHQAGKYAVVHADLVAGLAPLEIAVDFLHRCGADGIISTRPMLLRRGRELGMLTVLRVFAIDSKAVSNLGRETEGGDTVQGAAAAEPGAAGAADRRGSAVGQGGRAGGAGGWGPVRLRQRREPVGAVSRAEMSCRAEGDCRVQAVACEAAALWRCGAETMENRRPATAWEENVKRMGRSMGA